MRRRLFNILSALLLVLCVATCVLWVRSYWKAEAVVAGYWQYQFHPGYTQYFDAWGLEVFNSRGLILGRIQLHACIAGPGRPEAFPRQKGRQLTAGPADPEHLKTAKLFLKDQGACGAFGVKYRWTGYSRAASLPHPTVVGLFLILLMILVVRLRRRQRNSQMGRCTLCGYDLRATPDRCPECGKAVTTKGTRPAA
jgi:hypothetical protein